MPATQPITKQVYVFDSAVPELQSLIDGIGPLGPSQRIVILDANSDGVLQLANALTGESNLDAIHIFSHGSVGSLQMGSTLLNQANLPDYSAALTQIGSILTESGDLLLYGCNVAQGDVGQAFITQLASATGADVAASVDVTGAAFVGHNWVLESSTGPIETASLNNVGHYDSVLDYSTNHNYDIALAADLAGLSVASYLTGNALKAQATNLGWTFLAELTATVPFFVNAQAVVVERTLDGHREMAIAFRGTQEGVDIFTDAVPFGFSTYYTALRPQIETWIAQAVHQKYEDIYVTGHSLGGAAAQIAMIDMLEPTNLPVWTVLDPLDPFALQAAVPLDVGNRFLDHSSAVFDSSDWAWLRAHLHGVTIGAPSISADSPGIGGVLSALEAFGLNNDFELGKYKGLLFQFEQKSNTPLLSDDPVASLGSSNTVRGDELGSLVAIELAESMGLRYFDTGILEPITDPLGFPLHGSAKYYESLLRLMTGDSTLLDLGNTSTFLPDLPMSIGFGTSTSDLVVPDAVGVAKGFAGNDILTASVAGKAYDLDGGTGDDVYVIKNFGLTATISGPTGERLDRLVFNLPGVLHSSVANDDLVLTWVSGGNLDTTVTVRNWFNTDSNYQLAMIEKIKPTDTTTWVAENLSFAQAGIPLFKDGTYKSSIVNGVVVVDDNYADSVIGSMEADTMHLYGGNDVASGRDGNDSIYGGDGNDYLMGAQGSDFLYGEGGNDTLYGGVGSDWLYGGDGADWLDGEGGVDHLDGGVGDDVLVSDSFGDTLIGGIGSDRYVFNLAGSGMVSVADAGDGIDTIVVNFNARHLAEFTVSGSDFVVVISNPASDVHQTVVIAGMGTGTTSAQIEFLKVNEGNYSYVYNLITARTAALAGDKTGGTAMGPAGPVNEHYGTESADTLTGTNGNDTLIGYGGNDFINALAGSDSIDGGDGNDTIDAGSGNDAVLAGAGDDVIRLDVDGSDSVNGGDGSDSLTIDATSFASRYGAGIFYWTGTNAGGQALGYFGSQSSYADITGYLANTTVNTLSLYGNVGQPYNYQGVATLSLTGIEHLSVTAADASDLIFARGTGDYDGKGGNDAIYADLSAATAATPIVFDAASDQTYSYLGSTFKDFERFLITTGSGNDRIDSSSVSMDDHLVLGAGDDTAITGGGNDYVDAGSGNNTITAGNGGGTFITLDGNDTIDAGSGSDTVSAGGGDDVIRIEVDGADSVDGGDGSDRFTIDATIFARRYGAGVYYWKGTNSSGQSLGLIGAADTYATITNYLANAAVNTLSIYGNWGQPYNFHGAATLSLTGIEHLSVTTADASDLIFARGTGDYDGKGGNDAIYADLSAATAATPIVFDATSDQTYSYLGSTFKDVERFLITTGSGNDRIDSSSVSLDDHLVLGAGDDIAITGGGNDYVDGGSGNDTIDGGLGNDTLIGGDGTDTAIFSGTKAQYTRTATATGFTLSGPDGTDTLADIEFVQFADQTQSLINSAPTGLVTISGTPTQGQTLTASNTLADADGIPSSGTGVISYKWTADGSAISGATASTLLLTQALVGKAISLTASYTDGLGKVETASSDATSAVSNVNDLPTGSVTIAGAAVLGETLTASNTLADLDGIPTSGTGAIHYQWMAGGVVITDATNASLVLTQAQLGKTITVTASYTDSGNTVESKASAATGAVAAGLVLTGTAGTNVLTGGGGNDTIDGGGGNDTLSGGTGDDALAVIIDGTDVVSGGAGIDSLTVTSYATGAYYFGTWSGTDAAGKVLTGVVAESTYANILNYVSNATTLVYSGQSGSLTITGIENLSFIGNSSNTNDLIFVVGHGTYDAKGGNDTLYADLSAATTDITFVAGSGATYSYQGSSFSNFERYLLTTGSGNDLIDTHTAALDDHLALGAGNDTVMAGGGNDYVDGGVGDDQLDGGIGNDTLIGAEGTDTAVFSGTRSLYTLTPTGGGWTVSGPDGSDTLSGIEWAKFSDQTVPLGKTADVLAYSWNAHTLLDGVSVSSTSQSGTTNASGAATLTAITDPSVTLTVSRAIPTAEATATSSAVNLQDAIDILKMIVGLDVNGAGQPVSPYQTLAADFDGNGTVGLTDAIDVLKHVVGLTAPEPTWHFVNEVDASVPGKTSLNPGVPQTTVTADLSGTSPAHVGLVGYLTGDVDGSYAGATGAMDLDATQPTYFQNLVTAAGVNPSQFGVYG